jgi:hypothetical protein
MKVFETTVKVFVEGDGKVNMKKLKDSLTYLVMLDLDVENYDNPCDVSSLEIDWDGLKEVKGS